MKIGLATLFMIIFSKCISKSLPRGQEGHVLILTPFFVLLRVPPITLIPETGCSFWYLLRLPMLILLEILEDCIVFLFMKEYTSVPYIGGISVQYKYKCGPKAYNIT